MVTAKSRLVSKKVLIPAILAIGIILSVVYVALPLGNSWAQRQQAVSNYSNMGDYGAIPKINGLVSVGDNIKNFLKENAKISFVAASETAQNQIANGTVLGGRLGMTQGFLTYAYLVADQTNDTVHKVIIDAGNGQVLYTSEGREIGSINPQMFGPFGHGKAHGFGGGGPWHGFGGFWHGLFGP